MTFLIERAGFLAEGLWMGRDHQFPTPDSPDYQGSTTCYIRAGEERVFAALGQTVPNHTPPPGNVSWITPKPPGQAGVGSWSHARAYAIQILGITPLDHEQDPEQRRWLPPEIIRVAGGDAETLLSGFLDELARREGLGNLRERVRQTDLEWMSDRFAEYFGYRPDDFDLSRPVEVTRDFVAALLYAEIQISDAICEGHDASAAEERGLSNACRWLEKQYREARTLIHAAWTAQQRGDTGAARMALITATQWLPASDHCRFLLHLAQALPIHITRENWAQQRDAILSIVGTYNVASYSRGEGRNAHYDAFYQKLKRLSLSSPVADVMEIRRDMQELERRSLGVSGLPLVVGPLLNVVQLRPGQEGKIAQAFAAVEKHAPTLDDADDAQRICREIRDAIDMQEIATAQRQLARLMRRATKETAFNLQDAIKSLQAALRGGSSSGPPRLRSGLRLR